MALPKQFKANYLTQQMAMTIGRKISRNDFYFDGIEDKVRRLLIEPIEKDSGRSFPDVLNYIKNLDLAKFVLLCKSFAK